MRDFASVLGEPVVTNRVADEALTRLEVDSLGLDAMDRRYLTMIATTYKGGPVGVETLAAGLSEPRDTVEEVIEPYLIQLGLNRADRARALSQRWRMDASGPCPAQPPTGRYVRRIGDCGEKNGSQDGPETGRGLCKSPHFREKFTF